MGGEGEIQREGRGMKDEGRTQDRRTEVALLSCVLPSSFIPRPYPSDVAPKSCNEFGSSVMLRIALESRLAHAWSKASPTDPLQSRCSDSGVHRSQPSLGLVPGPTCPDRLGRCRRAAHRRNRQPPGVRSHYHL